MTIPAGHIVDSVVHHSVGASGSTFVVKDVTTGVAWIVYDTSTIADTSVAAWDVEGQAANPNFPQELSQDLADFGTLSLSFAYWGDSAGDIGFVGQPPAAGTTYASNMVRGADQLDTTGSIHDSNGNPQSAFSETWKACN
jgi:hypothetical protein